MAKVKLIFVGVTDTYVLQIRRNPIFSMKGRPPKPINIELTTGEKHEEGYCTYKVPWKKSPLVTDENGNQQKPETGIGPVSFAMNLQNIRFEKKMYSPNKIYAEIQIAPGSKGDSQADSDMVFSANIPKDLLQKSFINKRVILECDNKVVCDDYFVQDVIPTYKQDAMYVTFEMYSPDYLMTQEKYCRTFVSKKLGAEILTGEISNYKKPYDDQPPLAFDFANMQHIKLVKDDDKGNKAGTEHIFPYLVQYNESFYDFLKRTTNRWGEFMYYEDKKLRIGYGYAPEANTDYSSSASSVTYSDLTEYQPKQNNPGAYSSEAPVDEQISKNYLTKDKYDIVKTRMNSILPSNYKALDGDIYVVKKIAAFLNNDKTIYQFLVDTGIDDYIDFDKANEVSKPKNDQFNSDYFGGEGVKGRAETRHDTIQYGEEDGDKKFNQFSEFKPILNTEAYIEIVGKEFASAQNAIVMDFDTTYPDIKLGQIVSYDNKPYLVVKVEGYQPDKLVIVNNKYVEKRVDMAKVCYKVTAVPQNRVVLEKWVTKLDENKKPVLDDQGKEVKEQKKVYDYTYYPPVIAEGHIKRSGPQLATITEGTKDDPLRYNRVRIKYDWQSDKEWGSPWLLFSPGGGSSKSGVYTWHLKGQRVMVDYIAGNIERPYVVSSMEFKQPAQMKTYQQVLQTPWEQKILMTDGSGAGATAMLASLNPGLKLIQGYMPTSTLPGMDFEKSENLEGNIEMTDKYGFYSIKGSTNDRNITIKSPWGDVKISAFTGITLSAPNGDVTIKGKNVKIEAGGNLTLASGKNIKQKWYREGESWDAGTITATITKALSSKAVSTLVSVTDLSLLRHIVEVACKPVEGKLQITAGRYLMLEAGGKKAGYPIDAYKPKKQKDKEDVNKRDKLIFESFELLHNVVDANYQLHKQRYDMLRDMTAELTQKVNACKNEEGLPQCAKMDDIITALWNDPDKDIKTLLDFQGVYRDVKKDDAPDVQIMAKFLNIQKSVLANVSLVSKLMEKKWKTAVVRQSSAKGAMIDSFRTYAAHIKNIKDFQLSVNPYVGAEYENLRNLLTMDNLPGDCLLKTLKDTAPYNKFAAPYPLEAEKKKVLRKFYIGLVNSFEIPRSATESEGISLKPTVFPEPAYDCSDSDWAKYVRSVQSLRKKEEKSTLQKIGGALKEGLVDPFKDVLDFKGWKGVYDDFSFGASKKGEILFASGDGTMVLERGIYRANVGGWDNEGDDPQHPEDNGPATRVRKAMLSV